MQLNQENTDNYQEVVSRNEKLIHIEASENSNYLYPNGHRMTHQMRWFKGSQNRCLKSDIAA